MTERQAIDVEKLLHWAYRDELPKRGMSSAEGIWDRIAEFGQRGGIDPGHGAAQRYPHFGLPHPDAERIEKTVAQLPDGEIDWKTDAENILGELVALVHMNGSDAPQRRKTTATWGYPRSTPEGKQWGKRREVAKLEPPRDVLLVRSLRTMALVTVHAASGTRPNWQEDIPQPYPVPATNSSNAMVVGECYRRNAYSVGSYCPLRWGPSVITIAEARVDYLAWWRGLMVLTHVLRLEEFHPLPPAAPEMPWLEQESSLVIHRELWPRRLKALPLKPTREIARRR
jgi:hypothetical protein